MISKEVGSKENWALGGTGRAPESTLKKIQNYIFNFAEQLGQGNFSKVYKGWNEITSKPRLI
jgi:hypothetical protein